MAKKKTTKPEKATAKKSKSKQTELKAERSFTPDKSAVQPSGFSAEEIGHIAGDVWGLLNTDGGMTLTTLKKTMAAPGDLVLAAVGWLAREGKLEFAGEGRSVKISLR
jgi:hypothetical protein